MPMINSVMKSVVCVSCIVAGGAVGAFSGVAFAFLAMFSGSVPHTSDGTYGMREMFTFPIFFACLGAIGGLVLFFSKKYDA